MTNEEYWFSPEREWRTSVIGEGESQGVSDGGMVMNYPRVHVWHEDRHLFYGTTDEYEVWLQEECDE